MECWCCCENCDVGAADDGGDASDGMLLCAAMDSPLAACAEFMYRGKAGEVGVLGCCATMAADAGVLPVVGDEGLVVR
jgi:hypothetical protein